MAEADQRPVRRNDVRLVRAALESQQPALVVFDRRRRVRTASASILSLLGLGRSEVLGRTIPQLIERSAYLAGARERHEVLHDFIGDVIARGIPYEDDDTSMVDGGGAVTPVSVALYPLRGRRGRVIGAAFSMRRHEAPASLIFRSAAVGMAHVDRRGAMREINPALLTLLGLDARAARDAQLTDIFHVDDRIKAEHGLHDVLSGRISGHQAELRLAHSDGTIRWAVVSFAFNGGPRELSVGASVVVQDVTERVVLERELERAHDHLRELALHDPLTGLPNRIQLADRLADAHGRASDTGSHTASLFIDLDGFKEVNDAAGHDVGDRVLVALADRIRALLRPTDFAARLGGDEFVILCDDLSDDPVSARRQAKTIADRVGSAIARPILVEGSRFRVSASIGIALSDAAGAPLESMLRAADEDMYRNKAAARDLRGMAAP